MTASPQLRRHTPNTKIELLETRRLLSGWTTVLDTPGGAGYQDIAADSAGNLYITGAEAGHPIVSEKLAGGSSWSTIYYSPDAAGGLSQLAVSAAGDVYVAGSNENGAVTVLRRAVGQSTFTTIDTGPAGKTNDLAVDSAGDVYTVGWVNVITGTGKKAVTVQYWMVRKQTAGQGTFATVDQFLYSGGANSYAYGVSIVESGPSAGVYVVGKGMFTTQPTIALVRKSANGGSSWTTVDTFRYQGVQGAENSTGDAITADAAGNIYVAGRSKQSIVTRKSTNGGSFTIVDSMPFANPNSLQLAYAMATDHSANVYVVGLTSMPGTYGSVTHGYTRSNVGGTWATVDDFFESRGAFFGGVTIDPAGDVFVAGMSDSHGIIRTNAPAAFAASAAAGSVFSSAAVPNTSLAGDVLGDDRSNLAQEWLA